MQDKILGKDLPFPPRQCLLSAGFTESDDADRNRAIEEAKKYVRKHGLTSEDVKIVQDGDCILVVTKKEVTFKS